MSGKGRLTPGLVFSGPGYRSLVTMVRKGCWTGPTTGPMQTNQDALPPDYAVVRGCATDYCNTDLKTHDALPNLSQGALGGVAGEMGRSWRNWGGAREGGSGAGGVRSWGWGGGRGCGHR